ncbi:hypothetical protein, partial [Photorhabdus stackebrandtii]|uniref:hypothetical protein n=1 Tax=Photorhabdus stackebrandtii TaxID=1123042 RepID=UPI001A98B730
ASFHCQGRSLFKPLDSPGDTGGSLRLRRGNNFYRQLRVANLQVLWVWNQCWLQLIWVENER